MGVWDEYVRLNKPAIECCQEVKEIWDDTKNDEKGQKLTSRWNTVIDYQGRIKKELGDDIKECSDLMDAFPSLTVEKYFEIFSQLSENYKSREEQANNIWYKCFHFVCLNYINVRVYEKERYEETQKCNVRIMKMIKRHEECEDVFLSTGKWPEDDPDDIYGLNGAFTVYDSLCNKPEFKLCWRLFNLSYKDLVFLHESILLVTKVVLMCLYITLENEKKKIRKFAKIHGVTLPEFTEYDNEAPAPQAKAKKKTKQPREVFTERAKKYFEKAEGVGYLEKVDDKYKWTYRGGTVALVYFFIRIYEPQSPPFKQLQPLFGVEGLTSSRRNLEQTDWYKDEKKRQEMTPEELARERRERNLKLKEPKGWFPELKSFFED